MHQKFATVIVLMGVFAFSGCAGGSNGPRALVYQNVVIGADISSNPRAEGVVTSFGYNRQTEAIVPKASEDKDSDAMSMLLKNHVEMNMLGTAKVSQRFAVGKEAESIAVSGERMRDYADPSTQP